jgi:hypothetical protein
MSCGGGHLGFPIGIKNPNFVEDLPMIIPGQFDGLDFDQAFDKIAKTLEGKNLGSQKTNYRLRAASEVSMALHSSIKACTAGLSLPASSAKGCSAAIAK